MKIIYLIGYVGGSTFNLDYLKNELKKIDRKEKLILFIHSGGGGIIAGLSMLNYVKHLDRDITAIISFSASMATQIALACNKVKVFKQSLFMIHNAIGFAYGNKEVMKKEISLLTTMDNMLSSIYVEKTNKSLSEIQKLMNNETWFDGENIVKENFADSVVDKNFKIDENILNNLTWDKNQMLNEGLEGAKNEIISNEYIDNLEKELKNCIGENCIFKNLNQNNKNLDKIKNITEKKGDIMVIDKKDKNTTEKKEKDKKTNNLQEILEIEGISKHITNEKIKRLIATGASTIEIKAELRDIELAEYKNTKKQMQEKLDNAKIDEIDEIDENSNTDNVDEKDKIDENPFALVTGDVDPDTLGIVVV